MRGEAWAEELRSRTGEMTAGLLVVFVAGLLEVCSGVSANRGGYPSFTDEIPFKITWPDAEFTLVGFLIYLKLYRLLPRVGFLLVWITRICLWCAAHFRCTLQRGWLCHNDYNRKGEVQVSAALPERRRGGKVRRDQHVSDRSVHGLMRDCDWTRRMSFHSMDFICFCCSQWLCI